jgi:hypothetical protein
VLLPPESQVSSIENKIRLSVCFFEQWFDEVWQVQSFHDGCQSEVVFHILIVIPMGKE